MQEETIIGLVASVLTAIAMLPQLIAMLGGKQAQEASKWIAILLIIGTGCWVWYGWLKEDLIIIISNSFSVLVNGAILLLLTRRRN